MEEIFEVIIIGGGPAGVGSAIYSARKKMKTLLITEMFGGQSIVSADIGNWIGDINISGQELAKRFENHIKAQEDINLAMYEKVDDVKLISEENDIPVYGVKTNKNLYKTYSIIVASGGRRKKLNIKGEKEFDGRGVAYCTTCDAPLFKNREVIVVGSGNSALEGVLDLNSYASKIYLFNRSDILRGDPKTQERIKNLSKVEIWNNVEIQEILGDKIIFGVKFLNNKTQEIKELKIGGVFVEIGSVPNSEFIKNLVQLNERGEIIIDHKYFTTSRKGIFGAGDVTDVVYKQNNISVGNGVSATLSCYDYIQKVRVLLPNEASETKASFCFRAQ